MALTKTPSELTAADITITTAAQPNITSLGTLTTLTIDDITINGSTISDGGDLTIDVAGDIILDAGGGDIILKDDGTHWASLYTNGTNTYLQNMISDGDIYFTVNDGGSSVNALIIDGSEGGAATFNGELIAPNGATEGYHIKQTGGTATPRITNDANNWTILRPGASGSDVAINNYANSANLVIFTDEGAAGIGTTPKSWNSNFKALQIGPWGSLATTTSGNGESFRLNANFYNDGSAEKYLGTGYALMLREAVTGGSFIFSSSQASGSADGSIASWYHSEIHNHSWGATLETTTSDGSDNYGVGLDSGGGAGSTSRGAAFFVYGNEHSSHPGNINAQAGASGHFKIFTGASATERLRVRSDGNVGIGSVGMPVYSGYTQLSLGQMAHFMANTTQAASGSLNISTNAHFDADGSWETMVTGHSSNYYQYAGGHYWRGSASTSAGTDITWATNFVIGSNGHAHLGSSDATIPANLFRITGDSSSNWSVWVKNTQTSGSTWGQYIQYGGTAPDDQNSQFFHCGDTASARFIVYSDGDAWTADAGILSSDRTLKTNIQDATPKLADVMKLKVRNFEWDETFRPAKKGKKHIGFIAQEFEEVFPALVTEHDIAPGNPEEEGYEPNMKKALKEAKLIPILVKAIQEQQALIETLQEEVKALKEA